MTEEDYKKIWYDLVEMFGDSLPNPEQEPIRFKYYLKLMIYIKRNGL